MSQLGLLFQRLHRLLHQRVVVDTELAHHVGEGLVVDDQKRHQQVVGVDLTVLEVVFERQLERLLQHLPCTVRVQEVLTETLGQRLGHVLDDLRDDAAIDTEASSQQICRRTLTKHPHQDVRRADDAVTGGLHRHLGRDLDGLVGPLVVALRDVQHEFLLDCADGIGLECMEE